MPDIADLLILGDDPAAAAAAIHAGRLGQSVVLVACAEVAKIDELTWLSPPGIKQCTDLGVRSAKCGAGAWSAVTLHSLDFQKKITLGQRELTGWVVSGSRLRDELLHVAVGGGTRKIRGRVREIRSDDNLFCVDLADGTTVRGRIGVLSDECVIEPAARSGALLHSLPRPSVCFAAQETPPLGKSAALHIIPPAQRDGPIAIWCGDGSRARLTFYVRNGRGDAAMELARAIAAARQSGLLPALPKGPVETGHIAAGDALEMDSHVGKRVLVIGPAGGFIAATSNECHYTSMRSALLAAETAGRALKSAVIQDELASFDACWRRELADFVRPLHTDLSLLHPLLFSNEQMALRLARALLLGQPF